MKEKLLQIINYYGTNHQQRKFAEEVFELQEAITREEYVPFRKDNKHIAEEIADCMVLLKQFQAYYGIEKEQIIEIMKSKIDRQIERMKDE